METDFFVYASQAAEDAVSGSGFSWTGILICIGVIAAVIIVLKLLKSGVKKLFAIAVNAIVGCVILYAFSLIPGTEFTVVWWHALVTGLFGIPAAIILIVVHFVM
ncbi:MAG: hypothetical protein HFE48_05615 [Clostridia bacterium]|nr:hypothetical protein [Clostridia bacterium]